MEWHLAQFNVAKMKYPLDDARMAGFVDRLEPVNRLADLSPGFVWRHQTDAGDSTAIRLYDDPGVIINYSVWESLEALKAFTYQLPEHKELLRQRRDWFDPVASLPLIVMWWIPAGIIPTLEQARERQEHFQANGPTDKAFSFRTPFPSPT
ncbi:MAG: DUF3291 domain-containing protein [Acidimicrobiales bacterium]|nr:DUF3291 domain-containing protein [Acidimicrobiales bacterium]